MQRVMVIGASGAGKSTLARRIGTALGLPVIHLDREFWRPGWVEPDADEWLERLDALAARECWVIDGNQSRGWGFRLARADAIVWLDLPRRVYFTRAVLRSLRNLGRERADIGPGCPERIDLKFLAHWVWRYPVRARPRTIATLDRVRNEKRVFILRSTTDVRVFEAGLPASLTGIAESATGPIAFRPPT